MKLWNHTQSLWVERRFASEIITDTCMSVSTVLFFDACDFYEFVMDLELVVVPNLTGFLTNWIMLLTNKLHHKQLNCIITWKKETLNCMQLPSKVIYRVISLSINSVCDYEWFFKSNAYKIVLMDEECHYEWLYMWFFKWNAYKVVLMDQDCHYVTRHGTLWLSIVPLRIFIYQSKIDITNWEPKWP